MYLEYVMLIISGKTPEGDKAAIVSIANLVEEARSLAKSLNPKDRSEIEKLCDEIDALKKELENEVCKAKIWPDLGKPTVLSQ